MSTRILSVRFTQSLDMLKISGGHRSTVDNDAPEGSAGGGVRASLGQMMGEKGIVLKRGGDPRFIFIPMSSPTIGAIVCEEQAEAKK
jgi:hypothetical protein